jgi:hypothetical protein
MLRCPKCGERPWEEYRLVFHDVAPAMTWEGVSPPNVSMLRHVPCAAAVWVAPSLVPSRWLRSRRIAVESRVR